jgi:hypothetical protein
MFGLTRNMIPALLVAAAVACATPRNDTADIAATEGLVRTRVAGVQQVFARPGADLSAYDSVLLDPIEVSFRKHWDPAPTGRSVTAEEKQEIREGLARILREQFARELARTDRYRVVESAAEHVLRIRAEIRDLQINAPDLSRPGITRTYTLSAGEMTLVAELRDAPTGDLIARVIDHKRDPESAWFELTTRVDNVAAARRAAAHWATILREQLDAAHRGNAGARR